MPKGSLAIVAFLLLAGCSEPGPADDQALTSAPTSSTAGAPGNKTLERTIPPTPQPVTWNFTADRLGGTASDGAVALPSLWSTQPFSEATVVDGLQIDATLRAPVPVAHVPLHGGSGLLGISLGVGEERMHMTLVPLPAATPPGGTVPIEVPLDALRGGIEVPAGAQLTLHMTQFFATAAYEVVLGGTDPSRVTATLLRTAPSEGAAQPQEGKTGSLDPGYLCTIDPTLGRARLPLEVPVGAIGADIVLSSPNNVDLDLGVHGKDGALVGAADHPGTPAILRLRAANLVAGGGPGTWELELANCDVVPQPYGLAVTFLMAPAPA